MPIITAEDALYARVAAPDLDAMEEFLSKIGLVRSERTRDRLFMRGTDADPVLHVTELGEPRFIGLGFKARSVEDLHKLAGAVGDSISDAEGPGGGSCLTLRDPNGFLIEIVAGAAPMRVIDASVHLTNSAADPHAREGRGPWGPEAPPRAKRFGHAVLRTPRFQETVDWYQKHLGVVCSDQIVDETGGEVTGSFNRIDQGLRFVDHHTLLISKSTRCGWHHVSYEVQSWSEVFDGAVLLKREGRYKVWRQPVRHFLGGQVGAYVADPWGRIYEFWSDGDRLNARHEAMNWTVNDIVTSGPNWDLGPEPGFRDVVSS